MLRAPISLSCPELFQTGRPMSEKQRPNPLREGLSSKAVPQPCAIVIFGATGDLTHRKLVPALYNIAADGEMPPAVAVIGFARRPKTDDEFRREMEEATRNFSRQTVRDEIWDGFAKSLFYHQSEFGDEDGYEKLAERLDRLDKESGTRGNRLFYFAASPDQFETIVQNLKKAGLNKAREGSWARVILEKPFGTDLKSARHLNRVVQSSFSEDQTYRIDHFLGKETAQNILVLRFANAIFEPLWNTRYIDHVQITAAETLGVENRAGYYEGAGALRDMVQNHLLQLLCLVGMEPPTDLRADSIRDEKVKVVRSIRRFSEEEVGICCPRAVRSRRDRRQTSRGLSGGEGRRSAVANRDLRCACACGWITGAGRTCRSTSASANACPNPARKFPSISKRRRRCCSIASRKRLNRTCS